MSNQTSIESLRKLLDKFIDTNDLSNMQILRIIEAESFYNHSFLNTTNKKEVQHD